MRIYPASVSFALAQVPSAVARKVALQWYAFAMTRRPFCILLCGCVCAARCETAAYQDYMSPCQQRLTWPYLNKRDAKGASSGFVALKLGTDYAAGEDFVPVDGRDWK